MQLSRWTIISGRQLQKSKNLSGQTTTFNRGNLPSGLYFVRLTEKLNLHRQISNYRQRISRQTRGTIANSNFALCGLTFKFEKWYLRFMFVMADNFVFPNPAHSKLAKR